MGWRHVAALRLWGAVQGIGNGGKLGGTAPWLQLLRELKSERAHPAVECCIRTALPIMSSLMLMLVAVVRRRLLFPHSHHR